MSLGNWSDPTTDLFGNSVDATINTTNSDSLSPSWLDSIGGLLGSTANAYATVKKADALAHPQVAPNGLQYINGQFSAGDGAISPMILMLGAGVLMFLFLKK